jgi:hypothetical protein
MSFDTALTLTRDCSNGLGRHIGVLNERDILADLFPGQFHVGAAKQWTAPRSHESPLRLSAQDLSQTSIWAKFWRSKQSTRILDSAARHDLGVLRCQAGSTIFGGPPNMGCENGVEYSIENRSTS